MRPAATNAMRPTGSERDAVFAGVVKRRPYEASAGNMPRIDRSEN
jgi:hypothetical protein